jgi:hypothetical protein
MHSQLNWMNAQRIARLDFVGILRDVVGGNIVYWEINWNGRRLTRNAETRLPKRKMVSHVFVNR